MRRTTSIISKLNATNSKLAATRGFTLLEMLLALALIGVLLGGIASLVRVFNNSYLADERRVGRAQLARSISQMLSDDLVAAVQDPIQAVANDPTRQYIRHFGLRGDSRSLQIDVVQPNLFVSTATADENRRVLAGGDKSSASKQAPELKTIFYEFVPINDSEKEESKSQNSSSTSASSSAGQDLGSTLAGSLNETADGASTTVGLDDVYGQGRDGVFTDMNRPLAQKFGLSRRELDYETPDGEDSQDGSAAENGGTTIDPETGMADSQLSGSLNSAPDASASTLASATSDANEILGVDSGQTTYLYKEPMTAEQIAMDSDDGTIWAPEVLDCRFSYFDGTNWLDSWDSIEKKGLPIAIKAELKLAPLDDVDLYRQSPLLFYLPLVPKAEDISKLTANPNAQAESDSTNVSRLAGSLNATAGETQQGTPVDVFNSYRPLQIMRAALLGIPVAKQSSSALSQISYSTALTQNVAQQEKDAASLDENLDEDSPVDLGGGLGGAGTQTQTQGSALGGAASGGDPNLAAMQAVQDMISAGAVFNSEGVCVDFSNNGSYTTLEQIANEVGVSEPTVYEVVAYLPTTPLSRSKSLERRKATVVRRGNVSTRNNANAGASSRDRRAQGLNPYATGRARQVRDRTLNERTPADRRVQDRQTSSRQTAERGAANRQTAERGVQDRGSAQRNFADRGAPSDRSTSARQFSERLGANGGWTDDSAEEQRYGRARDSESQASAPSVQDRARDLLNAARQPSAEQTAPPDNTAGGLSGASSGGLGGMGGATAIGGVDPFAVIDDQTDVVPYANGESGFDQLGGMTTTGLIESPTGANTVASPQTTPRQTGQKSTWIRGK